jgi:tetratricopeptide (TPR) repeat protein
MRLSSLAVVAGLLIAVPLSSERAAAGAPPQNAAPDSASAPPLSEAQARQKILDDLFARLAHAEDASEAADIRLAIARIFAHSGSPTADLLMQRAHAALASGQLPLAQALLDRIVVLEPTWAAAFVARAQAKSGDKEAARRDFEQALKIEPRHLGALDALGALFHDQGQDGQALEIYRRALGLDPHDETARQGVGKIAPEVEGRDI